MTKLSFVVAAVFFAACATSDAPVPASSSVVDHVGGAPAASATAVPAASVEAVSSAGPAGGAAPASSASAVVSSSAAPVVK